MQRLRFVLLQPRARVREKKKSNKGKRNYEKNEKEIPIELSTIIPGDSRRLAFQKSHVSQALLGAAHDPGGGLSSAPPRSLDFTAPNFL